MVAEKTQNLQDTFLNYVRKNKTPLTHFHQRRKLQGIVSWFDNFCVLLRPTGIRNSFTSTPFLQITPEGPVNLNEQDGETTAPSRARVLMTARTRGAIRHATPAWWGKKRARPERGP